MSASSLVGSVKDNANVVDQGSDNDNTRADVMTPVTSIRLNDIDFESDLVLSSSDSEGLNGSELNIATTTEDEELRHIHPETIELCVLSSSNRSHAGRSRTDHHNHHHDQNCLQSHDRKVQPRSAVVYVESEIDLENEQATSQQLSSDLPSERMFRPSDIFMRSQTAASTTRETTADTEDDLRMSANKRTVKTKKKKARRSSASETDTIDTIPRVTANQRTHHTGRRATRRALDVRSRHLDRAETRIIFAPFPFAIISDNRVGKDNEQLRRAIALNNVHVVSDECDDDEGDVDEDNWNEKEYDEDDDHGDDESVASTCTSVPVTQQISSNIHPSSSSTSSSVSMATCRICFQLEEEDSVPYRLVSPCLCEGSIKYLHQYCLNRWIAESGTSSCELCGYELHLRTSSVANVFRWRSIELSQYERVHLSLGFFSLLFVIVSLAYMMWVTISSNPQAVYTRDSMTSEILFPIYACLDALTLCVCSYELSSTVKRLWRRWRATNSCLIVLDKPVKRRREHFHSLRHDQESNSSTDVVATEESTAEYVLEQIVEDATEVLIHHGHDEGDDNKSSASSKLLGSATCSHMINGPARHQTVNSDNCSVTLSITNCDPLTSCSNLAIVGGDSSSDQMYVEHINTETMV